MALADRAPRGRGPVPRSRAHVHRQPCGPEAARQPARAGRTSPTVGQRAARARARGRVQRRAGDRGARDRPRRSDSRGDAHAASRHGLRTTRAQLQLARRDSRRSGRLAGDDRTRDARRGARNARNASWGARRRLVQQVTPRSDAPRRQRSSNHRARRSACPE